MVVLMGGLSLVIVVVFIMVRRSQSSKSEAQIVKTHQIKKKGEKNLAYSSTGYYESLGTGTGTQSSDDYRNLDRVDNASSGKESSQF